MAKLSDFSTNVFSQFGEDGIVQKIFQIIGISHNVCIEFGAWDGFYLSNTANLWTNGWKGILIEGNVERYCTLVENTKGYDCHCINLYVTHSGDNVLENIIRRNNLPQQIDLLSIDIDGDDYYIFGSMTDLRPRVIICEYNPTIPSHIDLVPEPGNCFGSSALALVKLAERKGYSLISMTETNCFFVTNDLFHHFSDYETSLPSLALTDHLTYLMTGYSGEYIASRLPTYGCTFPSAQEFRGAYYQFPMRDANNNHEVFDIGHSQNPATVSISQRVSHHFKSIKQWIWK